MKFRTDFVTNSSDSSFLAFNVKNKKLFKYLKKLGIKIEETEKGTFTEGMRVTLPSGASQHIFFEEYWDFPYVEDCSSISAWLIKMILWELGDLGWRDEDDPVEEFTKELTRILEKANLISVDWNMIEDWAQDEMDDQLSESFDKMDKYIEQADIEHAYGFEGEVGPLEYIRIKDGNKLSMGFYDTDDFGDESCKDLRFVLLGKPVHFKNRRALKKYIKSFGGIVKRKVKKSTHYLICNDPKFSNKKTKKAQKLCIPTITDEAFIRRFGDTEQFESIKTEDVYYDDLWETTYSGGVYDFINKTGIGSTYMQVWKNGKWVKK